MIFIYAAIGGALFVFYQYLVVAPANEDAKVKAKKDAKKSGKKKTH